MSARWEQFDFRVATSERRSVSGTRICRSDGSSSSASSSSPDSSSEAARSSFEFCPTAAKRTTRTTFRRFNLSDTSANSKQQANRATTRGRGFRWLNLSKHQAQAATHCDPAATSRPSSGGSFLSFSGSVCSSTSSCRSLSSASTWTTTTTQLKQGRDSAELASGRLTNSYLNASKQPQNLKSFPLDRSSLKLDSSPAHRLRHQFQSQAQPINLKSKAVSDSDGKLPVAQPQQAANSNNKHPSEAQASTTPNRERSHSLLGHLIDHYLTAKRLTSHSAGESCLIQSLKSTGLAATTTTATRHKQTSGLNRLLRLGASDQNKSARFRSAGPADRKGLRSYAAGFVNLSSSSSNKRPSGSRRRAATCSAASSAAFCSASHSSGGLLDGSVLCLVRRELSNFFKSF